MKKMAKNQSKEKEFLAMRKVNILMIGFVQLGITL